MNVHVFIYDVCMRSYLRAKFRVNISCMAWSLRLGLINITQIRLMMEYNFWKEMLFSLLIRGGII